MKYSVAALAAAAMLPGVASAQTYVETDAGQTLVTASDTTVPTTGAALTTITGSLTTGDADLYKIYVSGGFSATTNNALTNSSYTGPGGGALDTALFLFDSTGHAIATNDDADGFNLTSTLSSSNALLSGLAAGYYYLGISISNNEAVNSNNQLLFQMGLTTDTRGAASGVNPATLATFDGQAYDGFPGAYQIDLTGVTFGPTRVGAVPEPATWSLMIVGFGLIGFAMRRRQLSLNVSYAA